MHLTSAISLPALAPSSSIPSLLELIGDLVAMATVAIAQAFAERSNGGLTAKTKRVGEDLIVHLYSLRRACVSAGSTSTLSRTVKASGCSLPVTPSCGTSRTRPISS